MAHYDLTGKYFFIAGASGGIGRLLCQTLKNSHADIFVTSRDASKLDQFKLDFQCEGAVMDGPVFSSYEEAVKLASTQRPLSGGICCTGSLLLKSAHATSQDEFHSIMEANTTNAFGMTRAVAKSLTSSGGGSIVLVGSAAAQIGLQNHEAIATAKGAIMGLTLSAAATYARNQIRVNCIAPGLTETPLTQRITSNEASKKASESMHPLGRLGKPEDIVAAMMWLLSDDSSWVTGQIIGVDGGLGSLKVRS